MEALDAERPWQKRDVPEASGPPSAPVDLTRFQSTAEKALQLCSDFLARAESGGIVKERCSMQDVKDELSRLHAQRGTMAELYRLQTTNLRLDDVVNAPGRGSRVKRQVSADADGGELAGGRDLQVNPQRSVSPQLGGTAGGSSLLVLDASASDSHGVADLANLKEELRTSKLSIVHPTSDILHYLRKTRAEDTNTLSTLVHGSVPVPEGSAVTLAQTGPRPVLYYLTFHSLARKTLLNSRQQRLVVVDTTTLDELRAALQVGGDLVPAKEPEPDLSISTALGALPTEPPKFRWKAEKRITGSAFGIGNIFYADTESGKHNYADIILQSMPAVHRPEWRIGPSMKETRMSDIAGLKVGEPYWFLHQGNSEHLWTIDEIRLANADDEFPTNPATSSLPYPISTYLSRNTANRCRVCDRDPGTCVTINDQLAGDTPCLMCQACFTLLHGANGEDGVEVFPVLLE